MKHSRTLVITIIAVALVIGSLAFAAQPASAASCSHYYYVKHGDSLSSIAAWYGVSWRKLADVNGISYPWTIYRGQKLCIPTKSGGTTYPVYHQASWKDWSFYVSSVVEDTSVMIKTANFPDNMLYNATIGCSSCGTAAVYVGDVDSGDGGTFKRQLTIPAAFAGVNNLWVRLTQVNNGKYRQDAFVNSTVTYGGGTGGGGFYDPYWPYYYDDIPTISISSVVRNSTVTIRTHNFPANRTFNVYMGPMGTKGKNGYWVDSFSSGNGSSQTLTFNIPSELYGSRRISIRTQSTSGGYYSYNWFYNNTAY